MFARHWPIYQKVVVNLLDGSALRGVLLDRRGPLVVLGSAELFEPGADKPAGMDGQVYIERSQVAFIQAEGG